MSGTLPAALRAVSDGPVRLQIALQRAAQRLRRAGAGDAPPVGTALPPLLLDGDLGPLFSARLRALLSSADAPSAAEEHTPAAARWDAPPAAHAAAQGAALSGGTAPPSHPASVLPFRSALPRQSPVFDPAAANDGGAQGAAAVTFSRARATNALSGAALLRDRISRALAAPPLAQRPPANAPGARAAAAPVPPTPPAADAQSPRAPAAWQPMTPAETAAALQAFAVGKPGAGRAAAEEPLQITDFAAVVASPAAGGAPLAHGAGSRSTLAPGAHFSSQGFAFADAAAAAPLAPEALADSLATILRTQARAHGIELP